jgi:cysteine synthase
MNAPKVIKGLLAKRCRVGDTPLIGPPELKKHYNLPHLLIKDESRNEFGTFKDRRNKLIVDRARKQHPDKLVLITSGNSGYSLARLAKGIDVKVICIVDKRIDGNIKEHLRRHSYKVVETDLSDKIFTSEETVALARENASEVIWDVTNEYHEAFRSIIKEIRKEKPEWLITPVGSGEAYFGLFEGLKIHGMKTKLVGVGVHRLLDQQLELCKTPSIADKLYTPFTPYKARIEREILREEHLYVHVSEEQIKKAYRIVNSIISCEPSSAAAFAALPELTLSKSGKVIVINSGKAIWSI